MLAGNNRGLKFNLVASKVILAGGRVEVYNINTAHAKNYLLFYIPSAKLVFSADHFGTSMIEALPGANNTIATLKQEIERLKIDVEYFVGAHSPRVLTKNDFNQTIMGYEVKDCPAGHNVCLELIRRMVH